MGSSGDNFQLKGRCKYKMVDRVDAAGARFTIHFDKDTTKFKVFASLFVKTGLL